MTLEKALRAMRDQIGFCGTDEDFPITMPVSHYRKMLAVVEATKMCCEPTRLTADAAVRALMERNLNYLRKALEDLEKE